MNTVYELAISPRDQAEAYIQRFARLAEYICRISPKARIYFEGDKAILKFTAIGQKWRHHIYVEYVPSPDRGAVFFRVRPPYPAYLLAVMLPFAAVLYPAVIIRDGDEIRGVMVPDYEVAVATLSNAVVRFSLLEPADFTDERQVAFEGYLHETPIGYVAFAEMKPHFKLVDVIEGHLEDEEADENVMHPAEFFRRIAEKRYETAEKI